VITVSQYLPLSAYAAVGNRETSCLVGTDGSIDWLPWPRLDDPSVFAAVLDADRGGRFRVCPTQSYDVTRAYRDRTPILETTYQTADGRLTVTDFVPPRPAAEGRRPALFRRATCRDGRVPVDFEFRPRFDYGRAETTVHPTTGGVAAEGGERQLVLSTPVSPTVEDATARGTVSLGPDEQVWFVLRDGGADDDGPPTSESDPDRRLRETVERWHDWTHDCGDGECPYAGPWHDLAARSGLFLTMLTVRETGAVAAAATTSLPEEVGGVRNWDYRFNWIRDSAATVQVLSSLGHEEVAHAYHDWFMDRCSIDHPADLQPIQALHGTTDLSETELDHLAGYRESSPVRIGNSAASQRQLDTYGELVLAIDQTTVAGEGVGEDRWADVRSLVAYVCECWDEPGAGIWEMRTAPRQFTHSKLLCWVALDRGLAMAADGGFDAPVDRWRAERAAVRDAILNRGYSEDRRSFVQSFDGDDALDASLLLVPVVGFLPYDDRRVQGTIDAVIEGLGAGDGLVRRYDGDDGLPGSEGAFVRASFWLVDALALSGRVEAARERFAATVEHANDVGLFAEEVDPETGSLLGNLPQAYSHVGLATSVLYLSYVDGRDLSPPPVGIRLGSGGVVRD
jgi:GH15 family glucan-1,4-alpha-glucosidase